MMSPEKLSWLPALIVLDGDWEQTLVRLYQVFERDFVRTKRRFESREIWWDRRKLDGKYDEGFWHIISTRDRSTGDRTPDFRRAERIPWCGPTISNSGDDSVKVWDYLEGSGRIRTYLWLEDWDYVIVLEKQRRRIGKIVFLVTAYYVSGDSTRRNLRRKFRNRVV